MSYIAKPKVSHSSRQQNQLGLSLRDYEGSMSTLCAGCGHDSISAAILQAYFELDIAPHEVVKMSGIGCSSKTPTYFIGGAHGINAVHGRMPSIATGANAANGDLHYIGVSGDGDTLSIGLGQFAHAMRRNVNMVYVLENNGVYGLTKGQFSASADVGSKPKKGEANEMPPLDPVSIALAAGCSFVARSFSGDKQQLVPLLKAAIRHRGFAMLDVISPCVTFNDHQGSTKSYAHTREYYHPAIHTDLIAPASEIRTQYDAGEAVEVDMHDGSRLLLRKLDPDYDPTDRDTAMTTLRARQQAGEIVTGLLYINEEEPDLHGVNASRAMPLRDQPYSELHPGAAGLAELQKNFR